MPLQATSGAASYDAFGGGVVAGPTYIEDVFSTWLYTGNGSTQTITNGIDLAGKGGLVWGKSRSVSADNVFVDSVRGIANTLVSNSTGAQNAIATAAIGSFNSNGFSFSGNSDINANPNTYVSWTFREQPKFFDVVTWSGAGNQTISHSLGSTPGCIIVKRVGAAEAWWVYHRSVANSLNLNTTAAALGYSVFGTVSSTSFQVYLNTTTAPDGYVAYLFAHDAGGFGLTGTDNVISCGSYTGNGSTTGPVVNLGYEPQWLMIKNSSATGSWFVIDVMRGFSETGFSVLLPNDAAAEASYTTLQITPTATGFKITNTTSAAFNASGNTYIYIAIRRGPMKVPTSGTSVFSPVAYTGTGATRTITGVGFPLDMNITMGRATHSYNVLSDRLRGLTCDGSATQPQLRTNAQDAEAGVANGLNGTSSSAMDGYTLYNAYTQMNSSSSTYISYNYRRAPSFFDEVCYTGTDVDTTAFNHSLGVKPEMIWIKSRSGGTSLTGAWFVWSKINSTTYATRVNANTPFGLNLTVAANASTSSTVVNGATSTTFTPAAIAGGSSTNVNSPAATYVAYLFATCAGVSKVGSYTGTGTTKQVDCGFTGGARFVLIKRTDSTGDWYVWDSARGIVAGNDPYLLMNSSSAEVTNTDYVDTYSAGFEISSTAPAAINASGGTFIFLAIA